MPEFNVLFVLLPAQEDLLSANNRREIDQSTFQILNLDFPALEFQQDLLDIRQGAHPFIDYRPAQVPSRGGQGGDAHDDATAS